MKNLIILTLVLILTGCASQMSWHVKYLEQTQKELSVAYSDSLTTLESLAVTMINQRDATINLYKSLIVDFVILSDSALVDSLLKKHGMTYQKP